MREYLLGIGTIPAAVVAYLLITWVAAQLAAALTHVTVGAIHLIRPDDPRTRAQARAAVVYGARRGLVIARGRFGLVLITGLDREARAWAHKKLLPEIRLNPSFVRRRTGEDE